MKACWVLLCSYQAPTAVRRHALGALVFAVLDPGGDELEQQAQRVLVEVRRHAHCCGELRPPPRFQACACRRAG